MFTLIFIVMVFFVLLYTPIMKKAEEQNCLAMLVFVSLLWATEVIDPATWLQYVAYISRLSLFSSQL